MAKKELWKIVLQPDGSWKNVYRDVNHVQQLDGYGLGAMYTKKNQNINSLNELHADIIELALEHSDYEESKVVLQRVMRR